MTALSLINEIKLILVTSILVLFVIKPLVVSFYQQRSGDYFSNRLLYWYSKMEMQSGIEGKRKKIMEVANRMNTLLWGLSLLMAAMIIWEHSTF